MSTLLLLDGHSLAYRAFFALPSEMATKSGELTNATYGFASMLLDVLERERPEYVAVAFDVGRTWRHDRYADYKGHRAKAPSELSRQIPRIRELVAAFGIPEYTAPGWEADDVLGTLARQAVEQGTDVIILSGDTDAHQLVNEHVQVQTPGRVFSDLNVYDPAAIDERYGLTPEQLIDLKAILGDKSDNIPGVFGVGTKTATGLLQKYQTLEGIYDHLDEVASRWRSKLEEQREDAFLSKELVRINTEVPDVALDLEAARAQEYDPQRLFDLFSELEFTSLIDRLPESTIRPPQPDQIDVHYELVDTREALDALAERIKKAKAVTLDVETDSLDAIRANLVGLAVGLGPGTGYYIPIAHGEQPRKGQLRFDDPDVDSGHNLPLEEVVATLDPLLRREGLDLYAHNAKFDVEVMVNHGFTLPEITHDTLIGAWLLNPGSRAAGLKALALAELGINMTEITELIGRGRSQITMDQVPVEDVVPYAGADVDMTSRLVPRQVEALDAKSLLPLFREVEMPLVPVLVEMECTGVSIDTEVLGELRERMTASLNDLEQRIFEAAGHEFNINSPSQLSDVLFEELKLDKRATSKTKTGNYSTAVNVLEKLKSAHPIVDLVLEARSVQKLLSTYIDQLPRMVNPDTGRIHTDFSMTVAETGRLSCLPGGTLVNTERGLVGIETVQPGEVIRTPYGPRRILAWQATGVKPTVVLKLSNGLTFRCSPQHRIRSQGQWIAAQNISVGDAVYMSFTPGLFGNQTSLELSQSAAYLTHKSASVPTSWSVPLAEFVGYLMADGHIARSNYNNKPAKVSLAFGWEDDEIINHFAQLIYSVFGKEPTHRVTRTCPVLEVSGVDIGGAMEQLGAGGKSGEIRVPPSLFAAPKEIVAAFLRGYFEGDGFARVGSGIAVKSTSRAMLEDVQQLLTLFGIPSSIKEGSTDSRGYAVRWQLRVLGDRSKQVFLEHVGFLSTKKQRACEQVIARQGEKSTAELLTLPSTFDMTVLRPLLYDSYRNNDGTVPQAAYVSAHKFQKGRQTITLPRVEHIVRAALSEESTAELSFFCEAVTAQYYEVKVTEILHESPTSMYDIAVEDVEQYVAQGIVVHNSSSPNLQNIPIRTAEGREIRRAFVAPPGHYLLAADYSQVELRVLAHLSGDEAMRESFQRGEDIHAATAARLFHVPLEEVDYNQRRIAKIINFGLLYGMGAFRLAREAGIEYAEAEEALHIYFQSFPKIASYLDGIVAEATKTGYAETIMGRRRYFPELMRDATSNQGRAAERAAKNHPIQGSAAEIIKLAMINIHRFFHEGELESRMVLQVHDELLFEIPEEELPEVAPMIVGMMADAMELSVPLKVDASVGYNWAEMVPLSEVAAR